MKTLNSVKYITESTLVINEWYTHIDNAKTWAEAKRAGNYILGYIDAIITFMNCMIHEENNVFTAELDETINSWMRATYQKMLYKALKLDEPDETIQKLLEKVNEYN